MFKDRQTNVHNEERSVWPSVVSDDLVQSERRCFTILEFACEFSQILCTALYEIIIVRLCYHKFCARWVLKMFVDAHKMQRMASALTFLVRYHKHDDEFLSHTVWVTGNETWASFVNVETKEQSK
jgi:hypothetical protein